MTAIPKLSSLQLELLKVYSFNPSQEDLVSIKEMLANFFAQKLVNKVDEQIKSKNITNDDLEKWLDE
jgi:hypothetical protein